jgi:hypothetical protein
VAAKSPEPSTAASDLTVMFSTGHAIKGLSTRCARRARASGHYRQRRGGGDQAARGGYDAAHVYLGTGGAPEAVLAAAALKCIGGEMLCRVWPRTNEERDKLKVEGVDLNRIYTVNDLVTSNDVSFAATGITSGELLDGV